MTGPRLAFVALNRIRYNPAINARRDTETDVTELAATIDTSTIGQPLLLREVDGLFEPVDGGRRFRALNHLAATGRIADDFEVPALIRELSDHEALKLSLATAITRVDLNPADEAMSFAGLVKGGSSEEEIAATFGVPVRRVKQRLAIAALPKKIVQALREGKISVEVAQAFTVSRDAKAVEKLFNDSDGRSNPSWIRSQLMSKRISATAREAQYVGVEAYRNAGGAVDEDLFSHNAWLADGKLLMKLFEKKLKDDEAQWLAEGWSFVIIDTEPYGGKTQHWSALKPEGKRSLKAAEKARAEELENKIAALTAEYDLADREDDATEVAIDVLERELEALTAKPFTEAQKKKSGVVVKYTHGGIEVKFGMAKPSAAPKEAKSKASRQEDSDDSNAPSAVRSIEPEAEADFTGALQAEMATAMTHAMQGAIAEKPLAALRLATAVLMSMAAFQKPAFFAIDAPQRRHTDIHAQAADLMAEAVEPCSQKEGDETFLKDFHDVFSALETADAEKLTGIIARCLAPLFVLRDRVPDEIEPLVLSFDPRVSKVWEPGEEFFKRMPRESLAAALGEAAIPGVTPAKKKKELVAMALNGLVPVGWLPKPLRTPSYKGPGSWEANPWVAAYTFERVKP
jgi:ParB family transcriptional regulator, chromosome partitioning protein